MAPALLTPPTMMPSRQPILVVDDDAACCESMTQALKRAGYAVESTTDALHALWRTMNQHYALVISDLEMPDLSGSRLLAHVRRCSPQTPAILVSGFPDARALKEARQLGIIVLSKPFGVDTLLCTVRDVLGTGAEERAAS
jgi:two-component system cell cycle sensor histidine kinase/response regulator CckA